MNEAWKNLGLGSISEEWHEPKRTRQSELSSKENTSLPCSPCQGLKYFSPLPLGFSHLYWRSIIIVPGVTHDFQILLTLKLLTWPSICCVNGDSPDVSPPSTADVISRWKSAEEDKKNCQRFSSQNATDTRQIPNTPEFPSIKTRQVFCIKLLIKVL